MASIRQVACLAAKALEISPEWRRKTIFSLGAAISSRTAEKWRLYEDKRISTEDQLRMREMKLVCINLFTRLPIAPTATKPSDRSDNTKKRNPTQSNFIHC